MMTCKKWRRSQITTNNRNKFCTFCQRTGHDIEECRTRQMAQNGGYQQMPRAPQNFQNYQNNNRQNNPGGPRNRQGQQQDNTSTCSYCSRRGHTESTCWQLHGRPSQGQQVNQRRVTFADTQRMHSSHSVSRPDPRNGTQSHMMNNRPRGPH